MTRTYRNRHTVPHGYEVRDGGRVHYKEGYASLTAEREAYKQVMQEAREMGIPWWDRYQQWRREKDPDPPEFRRSFMSKERKDVRKADFRHYRNKIKSLMRNGRYEDIWNYRKTGGWLTW